MLVLCIRAKLAQSGARMVRTSSCERVKTGGWFSDHSSEIKHEWIAFISNAMCYIYI